MLRGIGNLLAPFSGQDIKGIPKIIIYRGVVRVVSIDGNIAAAQEGRVQSFRVVNERREEAITPQPSRNSFVKPLSDLYPRLPCRICKGNTCRCIKEHNCCNGYEVDSKPTFLFPESSPESKVVLGSCKSVICKKPHAIVHASRWWKCTEAFATDVNNERRLGEVACNVCDGQGKFNKGGYHKKNPISVERILGSKWTAMERTFGWRHFRVRSKRKGSGKDWFVEMSATCDESTRFWVNFQNLKDRDRWSMGWLQKVEILEAQNKDTTSNLVCKACKGKGQQPCTCTYRDPDEPFLDIIEV